MSVAVCGLPGASSATVRVPVRFPAAVGENWIVIAHVDAAATAPQVVVAEKSPVAETPATLTLPAPLLASVIVTVALVPTSTNGNVTVGGSKSRSCGNPPVPESGTTCGPSDALSLI